MAPTSTRSLPSPDDGLAAAATGDRAAFATVYDTLAPAVLGTVRRILRDPAMSEEVTQDVFVEVWRTAARFDRTRGSATAWVLTLARRRAIDRVRSEEARRRRDAEVGAGMRASSPDPSEPLIRDEEHDEVRHALDSLTDLQRQSIELAYYEGMTYREVAEHLDAPLGTIKTRMRDGMMRLRRALEDSS